MTTAALQEQVRELTSKITFGCGCFSCEQNSLALTKIHDLLKTLVKDESESNRAQDSLTRSGRRKLGG